MQSRIPNEIDDIGSTRAEWSSSPFAMRGSLKLLFFLTPLAQLRECGSTAVVVPMCVIEVIWKALLRAELASSTWDVCSRE